MADSKKTETATETATVETGDHDRVAMLSIAADGTPDQTNPEIIGDKDAALAATKEQFSQIAVARVDADAREDVATSDEIPQDAGVADRQKKHEAAVKSAEKQAESVVNGLSK